MQTTTDRPTVQPVLLKNPPKRLVGKSELEYPHTPYTGDFLGDLKVSEGVVGYRSEDVGGGPFQSLCVVSTVSGSSTLLLVVWSSTGVGWVCGGVHLVEVSYQ
jgi:hypothetical protein